jgi:2-alkyl-3-oxoalkanoate reductase
MILKVAILGANGFIGGRAVEMLHLEGLAEVRPIVRSTASLARLSRFDLDCRLADAFDQSALRAAFAGCDIVIHAVAGDRNVILGTLRPTYQAAQEAGVRRLIYLSTASVHGQAPPPGTDERSPLNDRQPLAYNNAKVHAEWKLLKLRDKGSVELVMLRPGIVLGPRSYWTSSFADDLLQGKAYLVNEGRGICNSIYIDNLVHAICLSMTAPAIDRQAFLLGDQERITWSDFYRPIAEALGFDLAEVPRVAVPTSHTSWQDRLEAMRTSALGQRMLSLLPGKLRQMIGAALYAWNDSPPSLSPWASPSQQIPIATQEMALLHQCQYKLPFEKATQILGYRPIVSFPEACRRSIGWLTFAGYPVVDCHEASLVA